MTEVQKNHVESCDTNSNVEYTSVEEYLWVKLENWIHIQDENEFDTVSNLLQEAWVFDISQAISLREGLDKNLMEKWLEWVFSLIWAGNNWIILQKNNNSVNVYNAWRNQRDLNTLIGVIDNGQIKEKNIDYSKEAIIFDSNIATVPNLIREVNLLEEKFEKCDLNIQQTQIDVAVLENEVNENISNVNFDITYDNPIQNPDEIAKWVIWSQTDIEWVDDQEWLTDDSLSNESRSELKKANNPLEEDKKITKNAYIVARWDSIWSIIKSKNSGKDTQVILKYITNNPEAIWLPKLFNISKIKIGQELSIPSNLLELAQEKNVKSIEENEKNNEYTVQYWDTLYSIFKTRYPNEVTSYRTFMNKFNKLKTDSKFLMNDVSDKIKGWDKIVLP